MTVQTITTAIRSRLTFSFAARLFLAFLSFSFAAFALWLVYFVDIRMTGPFSWSNVGFTVLTLLCAAGFFCIGLLHRKPLESRH